MTVEEINKQLNAQDKLNSLSNEQRKLAEEAINNGLDITNINADQLAQETEMFAKQQEMQTQVEKVNNAFMGMATTIGSVLIPLIDGIMIVLTPIQMIVQGIQTLFGGIGEEISKLIGPLGVVGKILKGLAGLAIVYAAYSAFTAITANPFGLFTLPVAIAAAAAIITAGFATLSKVGDLYSPANGKTMVSTKEGGLFELSPNDDLIAAPGAAAALAGSNQSGGGTNLSALAAPMQAMVNEVRALRADLSAGKIAVYMDGQKVTNGVARAVDQSTRNSFNLGTV